MTGAAVGFIVVASTLCVAAIFCSLGIGQLALSGADAIERDGLARGQRAPRWSLTDSAGMVRTSPPAGRLQLIVFADHSLKSFPSVVAGLRELSDLGDVEIVILTRGRNESAEALIGQLGLGGIPVLAGSAALYGGYNVRVMPFAIFVDSTGLIRASSLVNYDWQIAKLRQVAAIPLKGSSPERVSTSGRGAAWTDERSVRGGKAAPQGAPAPGAGGSGGSPPGRHSGGSPPRASTA